MNDTILFLLHKKNRFYSSRFFLYLYFGRKSFFFGPLNVFCSKRQTNRSVSSCSSPFPRPDAAPPPLWLCLPSAKEILRDSGEGEGKARQFRFLEFRRDASYPHDQVPQAEPQTRVPIAINARCSFVSHNPDPFLFFRGFAGLLCYRILFKV
jgi:hypothetical protein